MAIAQPGTIFMATGHPNPELFPFSGLTVDLKSSSSFMDKMTKLSLNETELKAALQYQPTLG